MHRVQHKVLELRLRVGGWSRDQLASLAVDHRSFEARRVQVAFRGRHELDLRALKLLDKLDCLECGRRLPHVLGSLDQVLLEKQMIALGAFGVYLVLAVSLKDVVILTGYLEQGLAPLVLVYLLLFFLVRSLGRLGP